MAQHRSLDLSYSRNVPLTALTFRPALRKIIDNVSVSSFVALSVIYAVFSIWPAATENRICVSLGLVYLNSSDAAPLTALLLDRSTAEED